MFQDVHYAVSTLHSFVLLFFTVVQVEGFVKSMQLCGFMLLQVK